jgi:hypothetical protein
MKGSDMIKTEEKTIDGLYAWIEGAIDRRLVRKALGWLRQEPFTDEARARAIDILLAVAPDVEGAP